MFQLAAAGDHVAAAGGEEHDADRLIRGPRPCSLTCPLRRPAGQPVVQISILTTTKTVVITIILGRAVEEGDHPIVVIDLLEVVQSIGLTAGVVVPEEVETEAALHVAERIAGAGTLTAGLRPHCDVGHSVDSDGVAPAHVTSITRVRQSISYVWSGMQASDPSQLSSVSQPGLHCRASRSQYSQLL